MNRKIKLTVFALLIVFLILPLNLSAEELYEETPVTKVSKSDLAAGKGISSYKPSVVVYNSYKGGDIRWSSVPGAYGYRIYRDRPADGKKLVATLYKHLNYYDGDIRYNCWGRVYNYTVVAFDKSGRTSKVSSPFILQRVAPMKITSYSAKSTSSASLKWACTVNENKAYGYEIHYAKTKSDLTNRSGTFYTKFIKGRNNTSSDITGLSKNTTYYIRIRAYVEFTNSSGKITRTWSQFSSIINLKIPSVMPSTVSYVKSGIYTNEAATRLPSGTGTIMVGTTVGIKKLSGNKVRIKVIRAARTAVAVSNVIETTVVGNKATFNWKDVGYSSTGIGEIRFYKDNRLSVTMKKTSSDYARYGFSLTDDIVRLNNNASWAGYINEELNKAK